jgi:serine/threonine protein kinase/ketosteroid isomerase-like protein
MLCPNCQTPLRDGAQFCTRCGARTSAAAADSVPTFERAGGEARGAGAADSLEGRVLDGKYAIVSRLGEGGMGAVYRARRVHIGDEVAVKVLHTKYVGDPLLVERFRREARAAAQLQHPNVVTIHDYGEAGGGEAFAYIVMELVRGLSLRDLLRQEGRLTVERAASLMRDICAGVSAAHRREIVHRDLKPDNIIVLPADDDRERESVKVVDFGIAKLRDMASDSTLTQAGSMVGTPFYMSPEQCRGESLDARADVYSLGAMLYEMLAGTPPFTAPTVTGVIAKHLTEPPPPLPGGLVAPPALQAAIARALSKDPAGRQRDAAEFGREVQAAAAQPGAPPSTPSPLPPGQFFPATGQQVTPSAPPQTPTAVASHAARTLGRGAQTYAPAPPREAAPPRKSRAPLYFLLTILGVAALAALVGGGLFYIGRQERQRKAAANANARARSSPTPSPTATPRPVTVSPAMERAEKKVLGREFLNASDLSALTPAELRVLRNVPFARDGRAFKEPDLVAYFATRPWYAPRADYAGTTFSEADEANLALVRSFETTGGPPPADPKVVRREVEQALKGWAQSTRDRDLNAHARFYADTLETFYQKQNVSAAQVLADRARAFTRYDELEVELENVEITTDPAGARATAAFDKKWKFEADDKTSTGSVRQQLILTKVGGRWLITVEKDLQVYSQSSEEN